MFGDNIAKLGSKRLRKISENDHELRKLGQDPGIKPVEESKVEEIKPSSMRKEPELDQPDKHTGRTKQPPKQRPIKPKEYKPIEIDLVKAEQIEEDTQNILKATK